MEAEMKHFSVFIHWLPRVLCILAILFISLFSADAFSHGDSIWQKLMAFFMHLIPSFILTVFLVIAWKRELTGGIIFILTGLGLSPWVYMHNYAMNHSVAMSLGIIMVINFPFVLTGILFVAGHYLKKKSSAQPL
jgi:hypothetical protein